MSDAAKYSSLRGLYEDNVAQIILSYLVEKLTATPLQVATALKIDPTQVQEVLESLREAGLVDRGDASLMTPYGGVYSPTEYAFRASRELRALQKSLS